jgi:mannose-1-phosphate guanylyltransferase
MDRDVVAVVLAGGTGTRLYPASRRDRPKQFQSFAGDETLFEQAVARVAFADRVVALTGERYADRARELAPDAEVLVEPAAKDTGPALAYAARVLRDRHPESVLLCCPADHHVTGDFETPARRACRAAAETGGLVTMGVEPTRPETGYGYVRPAEEPTDGVAPVAEFLEKPDAARARELVADGCLWNAGIFAWTPEAFLAACEDTPLAPFATERDPETAFDAVEPVSVDYAVLERAADVAVVPLAVGWDDLGAWDALERVHDGDADGNVLVGDTDATLLDAHENVVATDGRHVSLVDVDDTVVAAYDDRVLVVPKSEAQRVREVVAALERDGRF